MNIAIVTGASSGIGKEFVKRITSFYNQIDEIWMIARRKEKLDEIATSLPCNTRVIPMDITKKDRLDDLSNLLAEEKPNVHLLVNCAGFGLIGDFATNPIEDQEGMIELNCRALIAVTHMVLPYMHAGSHVIQLASSAAFLPQPRFAVYAATKSFVLSFSKALGEELRKKGVKVTAVCPGPVDTEFFDIAERITKNYEMKKYTMANATQVVKKALYDSKKGRSVSVYSMIINLFYVAAKVLPHNLMMYFMRFLQ